MILALFRLLLRKGDGGDKYLASGVYITDASRERILRELARESEG